MTQLDDFLFPVDSPYNQNMGLADGAVFNSTYDRNVVTNSFIQNFTFDKGQGGTLTLGGTLNGNGVASVVDSGGTEHVRLDNAGVTVTDGAVTIQNSSNQNAIDQYGIVSNSNNFITTNTIQAGLNQSFTSTSFTDVTSSSYSFTLIRSCLVRFDYTLYAYLIESVGNTTDATIILNLDGSSIAEVDFNHGATYLSTYNAYKILTLSAGGHTAKLQGKLSNVTGSPSMTINAFISSYIIFGT